MAEAKTIVKLAVTGLGPDIDLSSYATLTEPVEVFKGYAIVSIPANLDLGTIGTDKVYGLWLKAESGTIYLLFNDTTTAVSASNSDTALLEGQSDFYSINPDNNAGIRIGGSTGTTKISYAVLGES